MQSRLISFDARLGIFRLLVGQNFEYTIGLYRAKWPVLLHFGKSLGDLSHQPPSFVFDSIPAQTREFAVPGENERPSAPNPSYSLQRIPLEFPAGESGDLRSPAYKAFEIVSSDGIAKKPALEITYVSHRILDGLAPKVTETEGVLPGGRVPKDAYATTLELTLEDRVTNLRVLLYYTVFSTPDSVLLRNVTYVNANSTHKIHLARAYSFNLDIMSSSTLDGNGNHAPLDVISTRGSWAREFGLVREPVANTFSIGSRSGISSHQAWPGIYLCPSTTTEYSGDAWAVCLVYSGDWTLTAERDEDDGIRVQGGLNSEVTEWTLEPGAQFSAPEAVLAKSETGLMALTQTLHSFVRESILPAKYATMTRPILANGWEAVYFNFDAKKLEDLAGRAGALGIELFVLDDGWFGKRDSDNSSLGDWFVNRRKLPEGLGPLVDNINAKGVQFGLWFEPEMISPDSELYRKHPDWCLSFEGRDRIEGRNQLILDLAIPEVRDYLFDSISAILKSANIVYVKLDHNRKFALSGPGAHWGKGRDARYTGYRHRHVLAAYTLMERLTTAFLNIHFEGCAGGGGRSDYGMMSFVGTYWISDDTDAVVRCEIQHGCSLFLPAMVMSSHVSAVPNHQTGRITTLKARTAVAMSGVLGYELDLTKMTPKEWDEVKKDVEWYKERRGIVHFGDMFRLRAAYGSRGSMNEVSIVYVSKDKSEALFFYFRPMATANQKDAVVRLKGLDSGAKYVFDYYYDKIRRTMTGRELMNRGLVAPYKRGDIAPVVAYLKREGTERL